MRVRVLVLGCVAAALVSLAAAGTAAGAPVVTQSTVTVTSPTGTYVLDDEVTPHNTITLTGTSNGGAGSTVDINCYYGTTFTKLATGVPVNADGTFSFSGTMKPIGENTCVLRAVNHGDTNHYPPGSPSSFSGPTLAISQVYNTTVSSGPNAGKLNFYNLYVPQLRGQFEYFSLGGCALLSEVYDPVTFAQAVMDDCNAYFWWQNGIPATAGYSAPTRTELQVDGADTYTAGNFNMFVGASSLPGFPAETYRYSIDPATGNLVLDETDQVVKCSPGGAYPPTSGNCTSFVPTGVQVKLHITQGAGGRVATVVQYFSSTDGHAHVLDMLQDNDFRHVNSDGELNFPWIPGGLQPYTTPGQTLPGPSASGPGSFFVKGSASVPDGGEGAAQGAVTFSNPPSGETIIGTTNNTTNRFSWVDLHYTRTVPASGSVALGFTYSNAFLASEVALDAAAAQAAFRPSVAISAPTAGSTTANLTLTVSGTAHDATGLSSVSVAGRIVPVASNGTWTTTVELSPGANTITALATNIFGNTAQAQTRVTAIPALSHVRQSHRRWRERRRRGKHSPPIGTTFSFALNEAARVTFKFTQQLSGRLIHGKCVATNKRNTHKRACTRTVTAGMLSLTSHPGANTFKFKGRLTGGRTLKPGRYTVIITATAAGAHSRPVRLMFTIVT